MNKIKKISYFAVLLYVVFQIALRFAAPGKSGTSV